MSRTRVRPALVALGLTSLFVGCIERQGIPVSPCTSVTIAQQVNLQNVDQVDLLFLVDNSFSMSQEQASLIAELPRMVAILASGDFDQDGDGVGDGEPDDPDFEPVRSLHVGVITSDMGTGGYPVMGCDRSDFGDDGVLVTRGRTDMSGCQATYPSFFSFEPASGMSANEFARDVACVATTGTDGCGYEQQLEALLKALSPSASTGWTAEGYTPPTFFRATYGHADLVNDGLVRENSVLAIIPLTDEEDCSARDPQLFDPAGPYSSAHPNLRCFSSPGALHPIERYVDGLLALRRNRSHLIYAPIVGIPEDLVPADGASPDWDRLISDDPALRDDRMEERVDPVMGDRLVPSCDVPGRGVAYPPIRMLRVAQRLQAAGASVTAQSICQASFAGALTRIIDLVRIALNQTCLPRELNLEADGSVACDVVTHMPEGMGCGDMPGAEPRTVDGAPVVEDGRAVCVVPQVVPSDRTPGAAAPTAPGWFYDTFTPDVLGGCGRRIAFTVQPPSGASVSLECYQRVPDHGDEDVFIGTFCEPEVGDGICATGAAPAGGALSCDPVTRACGLRCGSDADCRGAGLVGFTCDGRTLGQVDPVHHPGDGASYGFCTNPTCQ